MAPAQGIGWLQRPDLDRTSPRSPGLQFLLKIGTEWIVPSDAYDQGRARIAVRAGRPLDKLSEVIKKSELDRIRYAFLVLRERF